MKSWRNAHASSRIASSWNAVCPSARWSRYWRACADGHALVDRRRLAVRPLLQLDDDRSRSAVVPVAGDHRVEPAGGERELVLEEDAVVGEPAERQRVRERAQRVGPGPLLAGGGVEAVEGEERVLQVARDPVLHRAVDEVLRRPRVQLRHRAAPPSALRRAYGEGVTSPCRRASVYSPALKRFGIKPSGSPTGNRATRARCPRRKSRPVRHAPGTSGS